MKPTVVEAHGHLLDWLLLEDHGDENSDDLFDLPYIPEQRGGAYERENTLSARRDNRDARARSGATADHKDVVEYVDATGLGSRVEQEFRRLISSEERVRRESGSQIDVRSAVRRLAGDSTVTEVYERYETRATGDRAVGVALDMSGSMQGDETDAKAAVLAFARAVEAVDDEFVATAFRKRSARLLTGPRERFQAWQLDAVSAGSGTPTAVGISDALDLLAATHASEQLLLVVTDGKPTKMLNDDEYENELEEVAALVDRARDRGVDVLGIGVGRIEERAMATMFDTAYTTADVQDLETELVAAYESQTATA